MVTHDSARRFSLVSDVFLLDTELILTANQQSKSAKQRLHSLLELLSWGLVIKQIGVANIVRPPKYKVSRAITTISFSFFLILPQSIKLKIKLKLPTRT